MAPGERGSLPTWIDDVERGPGVPRRQITRGRGVCRRTRDEIEEVPRDPIRPTNGRGVLNLERALEVSGTTLSQEQKPGDGKAEGSDPGAAGLLVAGFLNVAAVRCQLRTITNFWFARASAPHGNRSLLWAGLWVGSGNSDNHQL